MSWNKDLYSVGIWRNDADLTYQCTIDTSFSSQPDITVIADERIRDMQETIHRMFFVESHLIDPDKKEKLITVNKKEYSMDPKKKPRRK